MGGQSLYRRFVYRTDLRIFAFELRDLVGYFPAFGRRFCSYRQQPLKRKAFAPIFLVLVSVLAFEQRIQDVSRSICKRFLVYGVYDRGVDPIQRKERKKELIKKEQSVRKEHFALFFNQVCE